MNIFAKMASVLALSVSLVAVPACKKSAPKSNALSDTLPEVTAVSASAPAKKPIDPYAAPSEYLSQQVFVGIDTDVTQDGRKFTVKGKPAKDAILPDGTRIFLSIRTCLSGATVGFSETVAVKDGGFECSPRSGFDGGEQLPAGEYYLQAFIYPELQPTALQSVFGERGVNLTGSQVQPSGKSGKMVCYDQHFLKIDSSEAQGMYQTISSELEKRRAVIGCLYRSLQVIRNNASFWEQGFASSMGKDWVLLERKLGQQDKSPDGAYGRRISERLEALATSYQKTRGIENNQTTDDVRSFLKELKTLSPNFEGMRAGHSVAQFLDKLDKRQVPVSDVMGSFVLVGSNEIFTVSSTSDDYIFYAKEMSDPLIQIVVERVPGVIYGNGKRLKSRVLQVVGAGQFSTVMGAGADAVIFKPLPE